MDKKHLQTPSQTLGPFFAYGLTPEQYHYPFKSIADNHLFKDNSESEERITIEGQVFDANGETVNDAIIELRQDGSHDGFGRYGTGTEEHDRFIFFTIKPLGQAGEAPHINVVVLMRGLLSHLYTRIYFSDEEDANRQDPILNLVSEERRSTLIAQRKMVQGKVEYTFDIHMQGDQETVFFDA